MNKKRVCEGAPSMEEIDRQSKGQPKECPQCGAKVRLYRTPRGLRCGDCVKKMDSAGLGFRQQDSASGGRA